MVKWIMWPVITDDDSHCNGMGVLVTIYGCNHNQRTQANISRHMACTVEIILLSVQRSDMLSFVGGPDGWWQMLMNTPYVQSKVVCRILQVCFIGFVCTWRAKERDSALLDIVCKEHNRAYQTQPGSTSVDQKNTASDG